MVLGNLGLVYCRQGNLAQALETLQVALTIKEAAQGDRHPDTAMTYGHIATVFQEMGKFDRALEYYEKVGSPVL